MTTRLPVGSAELLGNLPKQWADQPEMEPTTSMACRYADGPPCASLQCLHGIPSAFLLFYSSAQATILSPANFDDFNEQRDNPVQFCPPVLHAANASLVGQASRACHPSPHCLFHLRSHLPHHLFWETVLPTAKDSEPEPRLRILDEKEPNHLPWADSCLTLTGRICPLR